MAPGTIMKCDDTCRHRSFLPSFLPSCLPSLLLLLSFSFLPSFSFFLFPSFLPSFLFLLHFYFLPFPSVLLGTGTILPLKMFFVPSFFFNFWNRMSCNFRRNWMFWFLFDPYLIFLIHIPCPALWKDPMKYNSHARHHSQNPGKI